MNLFHRRAICAYGALLLTLGFIALRTPALPKLALAAALTVAVAVLSAVRSLRHRLLPAALILLLALLIPLLALDLPTARVLSEADAEGDLLECRIRKVKDAKLGIYIADRIVLDGERISFVSLLVFADAQLGVGDRVYAPAVISPLSGDDSLYYRQDGCHAAATLTGLYSAKQNPHSPRAALASLTDALLSRIRAVGEKETGALLAALLLGETDLLGDRTALDFRQLGISHILAVSGMHFVTLTAALTLLLRKLRLPRTAILAITLPLMLLYTLLTGASPSVLRAFTMALVIQLAFFFERKNDTLTALFFSGSVLFLLNPFLLFSLSFLLSFTATLGIVLAFHAARRLPLFARLSPRLRDLIVTPALSTLAATIFTLPIMLLSFGRLSLLTLPANLLLAIPFQLLLCLAVPALILGPLPAVSAIADLLTVPLLRLVRLMASLPLATLDVSHPLPLVLSLLTVSVILALLLLPRVRLRLALFLTASSLALLLSSILAVALPHRGHGLAIASHTESGEFLILGTGISRAVISCSDAEYGTAEVLTRALSREAITELSVYMPTHYGYGSLAELRAICRTYPVRRVLLPLPQGDLERGHFERLASYLQGERIPYTLLAESEAATVGSFRVSLSPRRTVDGKAPAYTLLLLARELRIAYLSGSTAALNDETVSALRADRVILGSVGADASRPVALPHGGGIACTPLYTAKGEGELVYCEGYLTVIP